MYKKKYLNDKEKENNIFIRRIIVEKNSLLIQKRLKNLLFHQNIKIVSKNNIEASFLYVTILDF